MFTLFPVVVDNAVELFVASIVWVVVVIVSVVDVCVAGVVVVVVCCIYCGVGVVVVAGTMRTVDVWRCCICADVCARCCCCVISSPLLVPLAL